VSYFFIVRTSDDEADTEPAVPSIIDSFAGTELDDDQRQLSFFPACAARHASLHRRGLGVVMVFGAFFLV
jgi:hypothetical protein